MTATTASSPPVRAQIVAAVLAAVAFLAIPFTDRPQHAVQKHTPSLRVWGVAAAKPRKYAPLTGRELVAFRLFSGALVAVTGLIAWHGGLVGFVLGWGA